MEKIDLPKAIVTSGSLYATKLLLNKSLRYFQVVVTFEDTKKHKPNAEPLLVACKKLKLKPEEAVYVGDMVIDYKTAKNAGTKFIGFLTNGSTKKEFEEAGAKILIKSLHDLPRFLENL
jgi:phosphoglycolate phosphatase-like HAD superfamily hydrolase